MRKMITVGLATLLLVLAPFVVSATDAPGISSARAASPSDVNWNGFYVGPEAGFGAVTNDVTVGGGFLGLDGISGDGGLIGIVAGYNFQVAPEWVVGVEGSIDWANLETTANIFGTFVTVTAEPNPLYSISGRAGWLASPGTMLYGIVGWTGTKYETVVTFGPGAATFKQNYSGWHVGAGIETWVADNVTAKIEGRYTDLGTEDWGTGGVVRVSPDLYTVRGAVVWHFAL